MEKYLIKLGLIFQKCTVNFQKNFKEIYMVLEKDPRFWASGISVVMHMKNPHDTSYAF